MTDASHDPRIGLVLQDRYRIVAPLAVGAMGSVYRGERLQLARPVAIKFLHTNFASDSALIKRFEREAVAMSRLSHPHCVSVIDYGVAQVPYIVMDFVTGHTLRSLLDHGPIAPARALQIFRQILAGLAHAHGQGIVHRDIKPANIMLTEATGTGDHVRILDFGLAKLWDPTTSGDASATWTVVGTPNYMSPEQSRAEQVDARSDLYSASVVFYEMLSGHKPFEADDTAEVLRKQREEPPPPLRQVAPAVVVSPALQAVLDRGLAKVREERFASAMDYVAALDQVPEAQLRPQSAPPGFDPAPVAPSVAPRAPDDSRLPVTLELVRPPSEPTWPRGPAPRRRRLVPRLLAGLGVSSLAFGWLLLRGRGDSPPASPASAAARAVTAAGPGAGGAAVPPAPGSAREAPGSAPTGPAVLPTSTPGVTSPASPEVVDASAPPGGAVPGSARPDGAPVDSAAAAAGRDAQPGAEEEVDDGPTPGQEIPADELDEPVSALPEGADDVTAPAPEPQRPVSRPVESLSDVKALIAEGRRNAAISGLVALRRKQPDSAYIPYLLGNLYFEKRWWTDGMKSYQAALRNNPAYRRRAVLNKNVIRALGSPQTSRAATSLVLRWLGRAAVPYLRRAAQTDPNPRVRQRASALWRRLSRRR